MPKPENSMNKVNYRPIYLMNMVIKLTSIGEEDSQKSTMRLFVTIMVCTGWENGRESEAEWFMCWGERWSWRGAGSEEWAGMSGPRPCWYQDLGCCQGLCLGLWPWYRCGGLFWCLRLLLPPRALGMPGVWATTCNHVDMYKKCFPIRAMLI